MEDILYQKVVVDKGIMANRQVHVILYNDRLELYTSAKYSKQELNEVRSDISYIQRDVVTYDQLSGCGFNPNVGITLYGTIQRFTQQGKEEDTSLLLNNKLPCATIYNIIVLYFPKKDPAYALLTEAIRDPHTPKGTVELDSRGASFLPIYDIDIMINGHLLNVMGVRMALYKIALPYGSYTIQVEHGGREPGGDYIWSNKLQITLAPEKPLIRLKLSNGWIHLKLKEIS